MNAPARRIHRRSIIRRCFRASSYLARYLFESRQTKTMKKPLTKASDFFMAPRVGLEPTTN